MDNKTYRYEGQENEDNKVRENLFHLRHEHVTVQEYSKVSDMEGVPREMFTVKARRSYQTSTTNTTMAPPSSREIELNASRSPQMYRRENEGTNQKKSMLMSFQSLVVFVTVICLLTVVFSYKSERKIDRSIIKQELQHLKQTFAEQDRNIWLEFHSGISKIISTEPNSPSTFILIYRNDYRTSDCLAQQLGNAVTRVFNNQNSSVIVRGENLISKYADYGEILVEYDEKVQESGAMVVTDIHKVPGKLARAFHYFCDSVSPLVQRAAYIFTLLDDERTDETTPIKKAERILKKKWSDLPEEFLSPLIARMVGNVVKIVPEKNAICS